MPHHCRKRKFNAYKTFNKNDLKIHFYNFLQVHLMGLYMEVRLGMEPVYEGHSKNSEPPFIKFALVNKM